MAVAAQQIQQQQTIEYFSQDTFSGGINTAAPADRLQDNEAVDILNFEFDSEDQLISRAGTDRFLASAAYSGRITSIHYYENDAGNIHVLYTNANKLYRTDNVGSAPTDVTGALTLPNDTFWMWRNFDGFAIGVNGATSGDNPVAVSGAGPTVAALAGSPPKAKYIEVWNSRVWLVGASNPNTIYGSHLGNPELWTTGTAAEGVAIDIDLNDGDQITGLIAFRERLFIFKRTKIYVLSAVDIPNTDPANLRVDVFANNIGCVSAYSIKSVLDDVLFLSDSGVASLASSEAVGDFTSALLSRNVRDISLINKTSDEIPAIVMEEVDQYVLGTVSSLSHTSIDEAFVLDYKNIQNRLIRWLRWNGKVVGTAYASIYVNGEKQYLIGAKEGVNYTLYKYIPKLASYSDDGNAYTKQIKTKAYNFQIPLYRKLFNRFGLTFQSMQEDLNLTVTYYFDQLLGQSGSYTFNIAAPLIGALWDSAIWDTDIWDAGSSQFARIWRRFKNNHTGRKGVNVQFLITSNTDEQGLIFNNIAIEYSNLSHRWVRNY